MRRVHVKVSVAAVLLALGLSACGGSDETANQASAAVTAQIEEICADLNHSYADRGEFPLADFDPENPNAADLPAVGRYFAAGLEAQPRAIASLKGLTPTAEQREEVDALVEAWEAQYASAKTQVRAALASDAPSFVATLDAAAASNEAVSAATSALGVPDCGQG